MKYIIAIVQPDQVNDVVRGIKSGLTGGGTSRITISNVVCDDHQEELTARYRGYVQRDNLAQKVKLELVVDDGEVQAAVDAIGLATKAEGAQDEGVVVLDLAHSTRSA